jgi:hypothetical protein
MKHAGTLLGVVKQASISIVTTRICEVPTEEKLSKIHDFRPQTAINFAVHCDTFTVKSSLETEQGYHQDRNIDRPYRAQPQRIAMYCRRPRSPIHCQQGCGDDPGALRAPGKAIQDKQASPARAKSR